VEQGTTTGRRRLFSRDVSVGGSADLLRYHRMLCSEGGFKECLIIEASTSEDEDLPDVRY